MTGRLRIVVADDHPLYRDGVVGTLGASGFDVAGEASMARDAVSLVREHAPELALFDVAISRVVIGTSALASRSPRSIAAPTSPRTRLPS